MCGASTCSSNPLTSPISAACGPETFAPRSIFRPTSAPLIKIKLGSRLKSPEADRGCSSGDLCPFFHGLAGRKDYSARAPGIVRKLHLQQRSARALPVRRPATLPWTMRKKKNFPALNVDLLGALSAKEREKKVREILEKLSERDRRLLPRSFPGRTGQGSGLPRFRRRSGIFTRAVAPRQAGIQVVVSEAFGRKSPRFCSSLRTMQCREEHY